MTNDNVNHPSHYTAGGIECIDALKAATEGLEGIQAVCTANAIKYLWRWRRENGAEDLKKAKWYIDRLLKELEPKKEDQPEGKPPLCREPHTCVTCKHADLSGGENPCATCRHTTANPFEAARRECHYERSGDKA